MPQEKGLSVVSMSRSRSSKQGRRRKSNERTSAEVSVVPGIPSSLSSEEPTQEVASLNASECTFGTHYPNRIFAGSLPGKANATELADFFRSFGTVLEGKIVLDAYGRSRRFGFVTFASKEDVENVLSQGAIFFKGKKINVGPAVKRLFGEMTPPCTPDSSNSGTPVMCHSPQLPRAAPQDSAAIVTVPPVNEKDVSGRKSNTGNVWVRVARGNKTASEPPLSPALNLSFPQKPVARSSSASQLSSVPLSSRPSVALTATVSVSDKLLDVPDRSKQSSRLSKDRQPAAFALPPILSCGPRYHHGALYPAWPPATYIPVGQVYPYDSVYPYPMFAVPLDTGTYIDPSTMSPVFPQGVINFIQCV